MKSRTKQILLTVILVFSWILILAVVLDGIINHIKTNGFIILLLPLSYIGYSILRKKFKTGHRIIDQKETNKVR